MSRAIICRWAVAFLLSAFLSLSANVLGNLKVAVIRISFPSDIYPGVTGNGDYLYAKQTIECGNYTIDGPPHDKNYFESHLAAVNNYFRSVSYEKFRLDIINSTVYPQKNQSSYVIQKPMNYYHELGEEDVHEKRITELLNEALLTAYDIDQIDFSIYDLVAVVHPGVGQDFKLPFLDPTPEDIPSTYVDKDMVNTHLGGPIFIGGTTISHGIILPETQNHLFYDESLFNQLSNPCDIQYSLTGTMAMMIGFAVGLPPLWDLESGQSGVGIFSLMDQGSNNGRGIIPAPPDAWTRINAGWELPTDINYNELVQLDDRSANQIAKIFIGEDEYFLVENRNNWIRDGVSMDSARYTVWEKTDEYPPLINVLMDSVGVKKNEYGVITEIPNYDLGLPGSGLLIWHINEKKIREGMDSFSINANRKHRGVDLEEADGAQDIGYISNLLTDPSSGYWGDMWFAENQEYYRANAEGNMNFSSFTYPNTKSNSGANTGININNISQSGKTMSFTLSSGYDITFFMDENKSILFQWDVDGDGDLDFVGEGDSLWWGDDLEKVTAFYKNMGDNLQVCVAQNANPTALATVRKVGDNQIFEWFEYDRTQGSFIREWENVKKNTLYVNLLKADGAEKRIVFNDDSLFLQIDENSLNPFEGDMDQFSYSSNQMGNVFLYPDRITQGPTRNHYGEFESVSLIDIESDGFIDILATDQNGTIHAFDLNFYYKNGFPIEADAIGSVLGIDLIEDDKPELVYQTSDGNIRILDHQGIEKDRISTGNKLMGLGTYGGSHAIITTNQVIKYKKDTYGLENDWKYVYSSPDYSRYTSVPEVSSKYNPYLLNNELSYAYPNPSYGKKIIFRIQVGVAESIDINIFDIAGFPIESRSMRIKEKFSIQDDNDPFTSVFEMPWDLSNIESGVYFARVVVSNEGKSEEEIIKVAVIK